MTSGINFDQYWGVRISSIKFDCMTMSIAFDLTWTEDSTPHSASLRFNGVSKCEFSSEKIFTSEVVELVSLDATKIGNYWKVVGELSNYEFVFVCEDIEEDAQRRTGVSPN